MEKSFSDTFSATEIFESPIENKIKEFSDNEFDLVFSMAVLMHVHNDSDWIFQHIARISKKKLIIIEHEKIKAKKVFLRNYKNIFEKFDLCIASNKETENYLAILGATNIKNYGNLKFSNSERTEDNKLDPLLINKIKDRKIWCAASTHASEELIGAKSHIELKKKYSNILTIIIPRHINRIEKRIKEVNMSFEKYSLIISF